MNLGNKEKLQPTTKKYRICSWLFKIFGILSLVLLLLMAIGFNSLFRTEKTPVPAENARIGSYVALDVVSLKEYIRTGENVQYYFTLADSSESYPVYKIILSKEEAESDIIRPLIDIDGNNKPVRIYGTIESPTGERGNRNNDTSAIYLKMTYMHGSLEPEMTLNQTGSSVLLAMIFSFLMTIIFASLLSKEKKKMKKNFQCTTCRKAISEDETVWVGVKRYCKECAALRRERNLRMADKRTADRKSAMSSSQTPVINKPIEEVIKQPSVESNKTFHCYVCERELPVKYRHKNHVCVDCAPLNPEFHPLGLTPKNIRKTLDLGVFVVKDNDLEKVDAIARARESREIEKPNAVNALSRVMSTDILSKKTIEALLLTERLKKSHGDAIKADIALIEVSFATDYTLACQNPEFLKNKVENASLDDLIDAYLVLKHFCNAIRPELSTNIRHFCHFICDRILGFGKVYKGEEPISLDGISVHFNSKNYFAWKEANPLKQYTFNDVMPLNEKQPVISLFEDGVKTREYVLETEKDEDFTGKYFHFMTWINVLGTPAVPVMQMDGFLADTPGEAKFDYSCIGYRMEGHFLNCGGESAEVRRDMNRGRDLDMKALKYQGFTTPSNIRLVGVCPDCGKSFCFHGYAFYMGQEDVAYSDDGLDCCVIGEYNIDKDNWFYETDGKTFRYYNSFNCPHCGTPYIDYKKYPENKVFGVSGCVLLNKEAYKTLT